MARAAELRDAVDAYEIAVSGASHRRAEQLKQSSSEFDEAMSSAAEAFDAVFKEADELLSADEETRRQEVPAKQGTTAADAQAGTG